MQKYYFDDTVFNTIREFILCVTAATSATTRNTLFSTMLYEPLLIVSNNAIRSVKRRVDDDDVQECLIYAYTKLLDRITRVQEAQDFLFVSFKNFIINTLRKKREVYVADIPCDAAIYTGEGVVERNDNIIQIIGIIDYKITQQSNVNNLNSLFLLEMKRYLQMNSYDPTGFKAYIIRTLNIKEGTYKQIMHRLGIRSKIFNTKIEL